jgi:DNA topoisomerase-1
MSKTLVIVESPGKIAKIGQYLGSDYVVKASFGHVQDLDKSTLSIDVENNFKPYYIVSPDKVKVVKELKALAKECKEVILAADGDREGEAIAHSLATVLGLNKPKRIIFHEITKPALTKAVQSPGTINEPMVLAQQARRLLDRLVGYKISPVLWKYMAFNGTAQSAGRVQSVVVRIVIDKENEIDKSISEPYFKTTADFETFVSDKDKTTVKFNSTLNIGNKLYEFDSEESAKNFLNKINKNTEFKVVSVENKKSIRKPSAPFITSTLQQEASTKLHFSVKKTMDVAQKLYEAGLITYMRTDSPNISKEAIAQAKKYIVDTWGEEYSDPKNYESKSANSQDAHECVRPTHLDQPEPDKLDSDQARLYGLIWKRTIASQMSNAQINIQVIQIDAIADKKSILLFDKQTYFTSSLENVEFPGYLMVYDNTPEDEEKVMGQLEIKPKDKLSMNKIKVTEEYTKPPLRYNEASLVKYLEKNGIGRPSTYASIISKVIERQYVEIKNVEGVKKQSKQLELDNKFKLKETIKEISIGKEQKKLVPTQMGKLVNEFMMKNFEPIMDIEFTANFESFLDKIADGKANWVTVLKTFYDKFNPMVEKLIDEAKEKKEKIGSSTDKLLGTNEDGLEVYTGSGKYGPYVKIKNEETNKWTYAPIKEIDPKNITLEQALDILAYPKTLGKIGAGYVVLNKGPYGYYIKYGGKNYSIKTEDDPNDVDIDYAKELIEAGDPYALKTFKLKDKVINIKSGDYGPYIQIVSGKTKQNISIPKNYNLDEINVDDVLQIIGNKNGTSKKPSSSTGAQSSQPANPVFKTVSPQMKPTEKPAKVIKSKADSESSKVFKQKKPLKTNNPVELSNDSADFIDDEPKKKSSKKSKEIVL